MIPQTDFDQLRTALAECDEELVKQAFDRILAGSPSSQDLDRTFHAIQAGMEEVGRRFQDGDYYLAEMIFAAEIVNGIMPRLTEKMKGGAHKSLGRIVLGTVKGDIHDIGKNLVGVLLTAAGFDVVDLGADVAPQGFVAAVKEHRPAIVALSGLLTLSIDPMRQTVQALAEAGLRDQVKVIIGGNPVTAYIHQAVGSDGWTNNAAEGVAQCRQWMEA